MAIEREALYAIITEVGNSVEVEKPKPYLHVKCGGNSDTYQAYQQRKLRYKEFVELQDHWFGETSSIVAYIPKRDWNKVGYLRASKRSALRFFIRAEWKDKFLNEVYGSAEEAFWGTHDKEELIKSYIEWFDARKRRLREVMAKSTEIAASATANISMIKRTGKPLSHGGVANLLKVLTKTMEKQGADITSIAKMQYVICKQAGILIIDEFIEDVATIMGDELN